MVDCKEVVERLGSKNTEEVRQAAFDAGDMNCRAAIPVLSSLLQSNNLGIQEAADVSLRKLGGAEVVQSVVSLLRSDDAPVRNLAMDILRHVGREDVETLIDLMKDEDPDIRIFIADILGSTSNALVVKPLCDALLKDPEVNVRYQAAVSLGETKISDAAKCLNMAMNDEEWVQFSVIEALIKIRDESSISVLVKALEKSSELVASMIVEALGSMGNVKAAALLLKRLDSAGTALRNKMVTAIVKLLGTKGLKLLSEQEKNKLREYLLIALDDDEEEVQNIVIEGLSILGGEKATSAILKLAADLDPVSDQDRLEKIIQSLQAIGMNDAVKKSLFKDEWKENVIAVKVMGGVDHPEVASLLIQTFWDKDRDLQREISTALYETGGEEAEDFFLSVLDKHEDGHVLKQGLMFLGEKRRCDRAVDKIFSFLEHPYDDVKETALDATVALGTEEVAQRYKDIISSEDPMNRLMAVYALGKMGAGQYMDEMLLGLNDDVPDIRKIALEALGNLCPTSDELLAKIFPLLHDENKEVRLTFVEIMGKCDQDKVIPYIYDALKDEDDWVRVRAVEALGKRGNEDAVPHLVPLLEEENQMVIIKTIHALGQIGGSKAFQILMGLMNGEDTEMQTAAEEAMQMIKSEQGGN